MLTIEEIRKMDVDADDTPVNPCLKAVVLDVSPVEKYDKNMKPRFYVVLADKTGSITGTVYNIDQHDKFVKGLSVILMNILLKSSYIAITRGSDVAMAQGFEVPQEIIDNAPKLPGDEPGNLQTVLDSPIKTLTSVKGKVSKVHPATTRAVDGSPLPFQDIVLIDKDGKATVSVWSDMVDTISVGQVVKLNRCRVKLFNDLKKLSTTKATQCEIVNDDELQSLEIDSDDDDDDSVQQQMPGGRIVAVFEIEPYLSCPKLICNNKKLMTVEENGVFKMKCNNCQGLFRGDTAGTYLRAIVLVSTDTGDKKYTMFAPTVQKLFASRGLESKIIFSKTEMMKRFMQIIPIDIKYQALNNTIKEVIPKRVNNS